MTETLAHECSSENTKQELSNEYQHDRVKTVFQNLCICVLRRKVASALEGLMNQFFCFNTKCTLFLKSAGLIVGLLTVDHFCRKGEGLNM